VNLTKEIAKLKESIVREETERDWEKRSLITIIEACKKAGWEKDTNHNTLGDDAASFIEKLNEQSQIDKDFIKQYQAEIEKLKAERKVLQLDIERFKKIAEGE